MTIAAALAFLGIVGFFGAAAFLIIRGGRS